MERVDLSSLTQHRQSIESELQRIRQSLLGSREEEIGDIILAENGRAESYLERVNRSSRHSTESEKSEPELGSNGSTPQAIRNLRNSLSGASTPIDYGVVLEGMGNLSVPERNRSRPTAHSRLPRRSLPSPSAPVQTTRARGRFSGGRNGEQRSFNSDSENERSSMASRMTGRGIYKMSREDSVKGASARSGVGVADSMDGGREMDMLTRVRALRMRAMRLRARRAMTRRERALNLDGRVRSRQYARDLAVQEGDMLCRVSDSGLSNRTHPNDRLSNSRHIRTPSENWANMPHGNVPRLPHPLSGSNMVSDANDIISMAMNGTLNNGNLANRGYVDDSIHPHNYFHTNSLTNMAARVLAREEVAQIDRSGTTANGARSHANGNRATSPRMSGVNSNSHTDAATRGIENFTNEFGSHNNLSGGTLPPDFQLFDNGYSPANNARANDGPSHSTLPSRDNEQNLSRSNSAESYHTAVPHSEADRIQGNLRCLQEIVEEMWEILDFHESLCRECTERWARRTMERWNAGSENVNGVH